MIDAISKGKTRLELEDLGEETDPDGVYLPSREEIARECAEIRRTWSPREHCKRASEPKRPRWIAPTIHLDPDRLPYLTD